MLNSSKIRKTRHFSHITELKSLVEDQDESAMTTVDRRDSFSDSMTPQEEQEAIQRAARRASLTMMDARDPFDMFMRPRTRRTSRDEHSIMADMEKMGEPGNFDADRSDITEEDEDLTDESETEENIRGYTKTVISYGSGQKCPRDGAECKLKIVLTDPAIALDSIADLIPIRSDRPNHGDYMIGYGDNFVTEAFDNCLTTMKLHEICELKVKYNPEFDGAISALDDATMGHGALTFVIELKSFSEAPPIWKRSQNELYDRANQLKNRGSDLFQNGNAQFAFKMYSRALKLLVCMGDAKSIPTELFGGYNSLKVQCYLNMAACQAKMENHPSVIRNCSEALMLDPKNVKGLYRRGYAYGQVSKLDEARDDLSQAVQLDPGNRAIGKELEKVNQKINVIEQQLARGIKKMWS